MTWEIEFLRLLVTCIERRLDYVFIVVNMNIMILIMIVGFRCFDSEYVL